MLRHVEREPLVRHERAGEQHREPGRERERADAGERPSPAPHADCRRRVEARGEERECEYKHRKAIRLTQKVPGTSLPSVKPSGDRLPRGRLVTLAPVALVIAGCGSKQDSLAPQSPDAHGIATLWWVMFAGSAVGLAVVAALLIASWVKRRERAASDRTATMVVLGLGIAVPIAILASLFVYSDIFLIRDPSPPVASAARGVLQVRVIGHQFWWEVRYPARASSPRTRSTSRSARTSRCSCTPTTSSTASG